MTKATSISYQNDNDLAIIEVPKIGIRIFSLIGGTVSTPGPYNPGTTNQTKRTF